MGYMLIASAKSWSTRGASHQPAFMGSCLTIDHACLPCLPSRKKLFWIDLIVAGKVMSCKKKEGSEQGRWERWEGSDKKGGRVVRSERLEGSEVAHWKTWQGWKGGRVGRWERGRYLVLFMW